jgi:hypothetical protein
MDRTEHGPMPTLARLLSTLRDLYTGLSRGLLIAAEVHEKYRWKPSADQHLYHHLARREAMAHLRECDPRLEQAENLGLPMSGLLLRPTTSDILRVWYSDDGQVRAPDTSSGRQFVTQASAAFDLFDEEDDVYLPVMPSVCKTYAQWAAKENRLVRFDLVRPRGYRNGRIEEDWRIDLLAAEHGVAEEARATPPTMHVQDDGD